MTDLRRLADTVVSRTMEICAVPAPTGDEAARADLVQAWWSGDELDEIHADAAGNVWGRLRAGDPGRPCVLVAAHLDTVFPRSVIHGARRCGDRLLGPSVGDNSVAAAAVSTITELLPPNVRHELWLVGTVGEEGLGNLRGIRAALQQPPRPVRAVIAVEGNYLGRVNVVGVGSARYRVQIRGPGGHAWEDARVPSAVHVAARLVGELDALAMPPTRTVNVGLIDGGTSVNARAPACQFTVDLRSDNQADLDDLSAAAHQVLAAPSGTSLEITEVGRRPAGRIADDHPLVQAAQEALTGVGLSAELTAASTDANVAYLAGIPAVTVGITTGAGTHSETEWIEVQPIATGLSALAATIARIDDEDW